MSKCLIKQQSVIQWRSDGTLGFNMRPKATPVQVDEPVQTVAVQKPRKKSKKRRDPAKPKKKRKRADETNEKVQDNPSKKTTKRKAPKKAPAVEKKGAVPPKAPRKVVGVLKRRKRRAKDVAKRRIQEAVSEMLPEPAVKIKPSVPSVPKPKMQSVNADTTPEILQMEGNLTASETTVEAETRNLNRTNATTGFDGWLEAEIRQMLEDSTQEHFCLETDARVDQLREDLVRFTRSEEDNMLIEVSPRSPHACEMGRSCESVKMSIDTGVSPPIILGAVQKQGFNNYKQCLLCLRNTATSTLLRLRMDKVGMVRDGCLQTHANYCNINGEYRKIDMLPIRRDRYEGIVLPIVAHRYSGYKAKEFTDANGKKRRYWCQKEGYPYPNMSMPSPDLMTQTNANNEETTDQSSFLLNAPRRKAMN